MILTAAHVLDVSLTEDTVLVNRDSYSFPRIFILQNVSINVLAIRIQSSPDGVTWTNETLSNGATQVTLGAVGSGTEVTVERIVTEGFLRIRASGGGSDRDLYVATGYLTDLGTTSLPDLVGITLAATIAQLNEAGAFFAATDITGAEAETLTDGSNADALHVHDTAGITDHAITAVKLGYAADAIVISQHGITDVANGTNLKTAYTAACALTPGGNVLAIDNRAVLYVPPGNYDFGDTAWNVDTDFVDLIGEGVCRLLESGEIAFPDSKLICDTDTEVVNVTCRDIFMHSFHIEQETDMPANRGLVIDNANACDRGRFIDIGVTMPGVTRKAIDDGTNTEIAAYFEQCHSLAPVLYVGTLSGMCVNCSGVSSSLAGSGVASGTFKDCTAVGNFTFGGQGTASGTFENCIGGNGSFGGAAGTASGTFENCIGGSGSFGGGGGSATGTFEDCVSGEDSFGGGGNSGTLAVMRRCRSVARSDAIKLWQGLMVDCEVEVTGANNNAVELNDNNARIYNCTLIANGAGDSVYAAGAQNARIAHCRMNLGLHANVTNLIVAPQNVDDANVEL